MWRRPSKGNLRGLDNLTLLTSICISCSKCLWPQSSSEKDIFCSIAIQINFTTFKLAYFHHLLFWEIWWSKEKHNRSFMTRTLQKGSCHWQSPVAVRKSLRTDRLMTRPNSRIQLGDFERNRLHQLSVNLLLYFLYILYFILLIKWRGLQCRCQGREA